MLLRLAGGAGSYSSSAWLRKEVSDVVQAEREELRTQGIDPDRYFTKRHEVHAEALAAR
jgi:hypothetical protein